MELNGFERNKKMSDTLVRGGDFPYAALEVYCLKVKLRLRENAILPPFKGSTFRGLIGNALLEAFCPRKRENCQSCRNLFSCPYPNFFKPHMARGGKSTPSTFVVDPAADRRTSLAEGEELEFSLKVFGTASRWLPMVLASISRAGKTGLLGTKRARFDLVSPQSPEGGPSLEAWARGKVQGLRIYKASSLRPPVDEVRAIRFVTPCKLKEEGRVRSKLEGEAILRAIERRAASLTHFYVHRDAPHEQSWTERPFLETGESQLKWVVLERPSATQGERVNIGGWVGRVSVVNCNPQGALLLRLGQLIHIGKNTVCGCGKFLLELDTTGKIPKTPRPTV